VGVQWAPKLKNGQKPPSEKVKIGRHFVFLAQWFSDSWQFNHNYNKYSIWDFLRKPIKPSVYYYVFPSGRFPGLEAPSEKVKIGRHFVF